MTRMDEVYKINFIWWFEIVAELKYKFRTELQLKQN